MPLLRLRVTGSEDAARAIGNLLTSIEGIEHVEEVADLMPHMDDPDSSSAGLPDDMGPGLQVIEAEAESLTARMQKNGRSRRRASAATAAASISTAMAPVACRRRFSSGVRTK